MRYTEQEYADARAIWLDGPTGLAAILRDHQRLRSALVRVYDDAAAGSESERRLDRIRREVLAALQFKHPAEMIPFDLPQFAGGPRTPREVALREMIATTLAHVWQLCETNDLMDQHGDVSAWHTAAGWIVRAMRENGLTVAAGKTVTPREQLRLLDRYGVQLAVSESADRSHPVLVREARWWSERFGDTRGPFALERRDVCETEWQRVNPARWDGLGES